MSNESPKNATGAAKPQRTSLGEGLLGGLQMMQQQREDHAAAGAKLAAAVNALAEALQQLRIAFASRGLKR